MNQVNIEQARFNMLQQQIRPWDVVDERVLAAMDTTPRENFVPEAYRNLAFADICIPLAHGQVMMPPRVEARMLQALAIKPTDSILEIGTGSGYVTALLAKLGRHVLSVDIHADLTREAEQKLHDNKIQHVNLQTGDASEGWDKLQATYDVIAITGSLPALQETFQYNLAFGGRLFCIVGESPVMSAALITRVGEHEWSHETLFETDLPALENAVAPQDFVL